MKYLILLLALLQVPFFPSAFNVFACGFATGMFIAVLIVERK